jgi:hypothetical protein
MLTKEALTTPRYDAHPIRTPAHRQNTTPPRQALKLNDIHHSSPLLASIYPTPADLHSRLYPPLLPSHLHTPPLSPFTIPHLHQPPSTQHQTTPSHHPHGPAHRDAVGLPVVTGSSNCGVTPNELVFRPPRSQTRDAVLAFQQRMNGRSYALDSQSAIMET